MKTTEIWEHYSGHKCHACGGWKRKQDAFCFACYMRLPALLKSSLWSRFGGDFEQAYCGCLSWFRVNPRLFTEAEKPVQQGLFPKGRA